MGKDSEGNSFEMPEWMNRMGGIQSILAEQQASPAQWQQQQAMDYFGIPVAQFDIPPYESGGGGGTDQLLEEFGNIIQQGADMTLPGAMVNDLMEVDWENPSWDDVENVLGDNAGDIVSEVVNHGSTTGIGGPVGAIVDNWEVIKDSVSDVGDWASDQWEDLGDWTGFWKQGEQPGTPQGQQEKYQQGDDTVFRPDDQGGTPAADDPREGWEAEMAELQNRGRGFSGDLDDLLYDYSQTKSEFETPRSMQAENPNQRSYGSAVTSGGVPRAQQGENVVFTEGDINRLRIARPGPETEALIAKHSEQAMIDKANSMYEEQRVLQANAALDRYESNRGRLEERRTTNQTAIDDLQARIDNYKPQAAQSATPTPMGDNTRGPKTTPSFGGQQYQNPTIPAPLGDRGVTSMPAQEGGNTNPFSFGNNPFGGQAWFDNWTPEQWAGMNELANSGGLGEGSNYTPQAPETPGWEFLDNYVRDNPPSGGGGGSGGGTNAPFASGLRDGTGTLALEDTYMGKTLIGPENIAYKAGQDRARESFSGGALEHQFGQLEAGRAYQDAQARQNAIFGLMQPPSALGGFNQAAAGAQASQSNIANINMANSQFQQAQSGAMMGGLGQMGGMGLMALLGK